MTSEEIIDRLKTILEELRWNLDDYKAMFPEETDADHDNYIYRLVGRERANIQFLINDIGGSYGD